jgi:hypothetical protein
VYAILDNLSTHHADDVLIFSVRHPRWEFVFQPTYAAYLNLIEPWWKVLRSLALKGRRFETWEELAAAVQEATNYWTAHKHPFIWAADDGIDRAASTVLALSQPRFERAGVSGIRLAQTKSPPSSRGESANVFMSGERAHEWCVVQGEADGAGTSVVDHLEDEVRSVSDRCAARCAASWSAHAAHCTFRR